MTVDVCKRLVYWGQFGPTCWFNALLMVILYSQYSRDCVLNASKTWDDKMKIYKIFKHILKYKFVKSKKPEKDIKFFERIKPEKILQMLHEYKSNKFIFNPKKHYRSGFSPDIYIKKFYKMLNVNCLQFTRFDNNTVAYSKKNHMYPETVNIKNNLISYKTKIKSIDYVQRKLKTIPDVIVVECNDSKDVINFYGGSYKNYIFKDVQIASMNNTIIFNNAHYVLDSVILSNWNHSEISKSHAIAGITCNNDRYVYNGWTRYTKDTTMPQNQNTKDYLKVPCELMKFNWDVKRNHDFCINLSQCKLDLPNKKELCFSFSKGKRLLVYIKKPTYDINMNILHTPEYVSLGKSPKKCPDGKILNSNTGRCIKIPVLKMKSSKTPKKCPDGKILNPNTGRCIKIPVLKMKSSKSPKKCPDGKSISGHLKLDLHNPINSINHIKQCPSGKILDPITKRCILLATAKKRNLI
jgi:hypothetical protein